MVKLDLELLALPNGIYAQQKSIELNVSSYVHKRIERFIYSPFLKTDATPISYIEYDKVDANKNIQIIDKLNSYRNNILIQEDYIVTNVQSVRLPYKNILATHKYSIINNKKVPLFYKHRLPEGTLNCEVSQISSDEVKRDFDFLIDIDAGFIYTNANNYYNELTKDYLLFTVHGATRSGSFNQILNVESVISEASWEDLDQDTGFIKEGSAVYTKENSTNSYLYRFNLNSDYYIKPEKEETFNIKPFDNSSVDTSWFFRLSNGSFNLLKDGKVLNYTLPEYNTQSFFPYYPIRYSTFIEAKYVNEKILKIPQDNLFIKPETGQHFELRIFNSDGILIKVFSTDNSLHGSKYKDTSVIYEDGITSWDNYSGFIALKNSIDISWKYNASYFYNSKDYEYTLLNLNPVFNKEILNSTVVFYLIPNTISNALHYLLISKDGQIKYTSQSQGIDYPNLQLLNSDNTYNTNNIIGMKYLSEINDNFLSTYSYGYDNNHNYLIVAELNFIDNLLVENIVKFDLTRKGNSLEPLKLNKTYRKNPKLLQSVYGFGKNGQEVPFTGSGIIELPIELLEEYGGHMTKTEAEKLAKTHYPAYNAGIVDWVYPKTVLDGTSITPGQVKLTFTWEGPDYNYLIYRKSNYSDMWVLIGTVTSLVNQNLVYTDINLQSGNTYYYAVALENNVVYPNSNSVCVKVA